MQINFHLKRTLTIILVGFISSVVTAQSNDGWYKVYKGKMGNYTATLHLHRTSKNYSGYLWFLQNQWPMQLYYNEPAKKTDSLYLSAISGQMSIVLSGVLSETGFTGLSELSKDNSAPKKAGFDLQVSTEKTFTPFNYYYTLGSATLPPALKNRSDRKYSAAVIWPQNNNSTGQAYKNSIRQMLEIKTPVEEIGRWLIDEKNRCLAAWKKEYSKVSPKEAADMGLSYSVEEDIQVLVMYENEQFITLANYNFGYSGGAAHGSFATKLATFNKQNGKKLILRDVINTAGIQRLPVILDQVARIQYGVKNNQPLDQNGFLVNKIAPNENFYLTDNGIGFIYAPYAIKSFADGEINLLVPFSVLKAYLQPGIAIK